MSYVNKSDGVLGKKCCINFEAYDQNCVTQVRIGGGKTVFWYSLTVASWLCYLNVCASKMSLQETLSKHIVI